MCVILVAEQNRLTAEQVRQAAEANPDGIGMAWVSGRSIAWEKDLSTGDALWLAKRVPMPYVFHARIATVGGIEPVLCHPFPVDASAGGRETSGRSRAVLFHNGTWRLWRETLTDVEGLTDTKRPRGPWSDSRAMAWASARLGTSFLQTIDDYQRIVLLTRRGAKRFGDGWSRTKNGVWASNRYWENRQRVCGFAQEPFALTAEAVSA